MSNNLVSQPLVIPNKQMEPTPKKLEVVPTSVMISGISSSPSVQQFDASNKMSKSGVPQCTMPSQHNDRSNTHSSSNQGPPKMSLPIKRTAAGEHIPNRNMAQVEQFTNKPGMQQASKPASNKKMARNESIPVRQGSKQVQIPKSRTVQVEPSPKNKGETNESVRSKMRESLASALALVTEQQAEASKTDANPSADSALKSDKESTSADKALDGNGDIAQGSKSNEPEFQYATTALSGEEFPFSDNFFVQDELLQGNGLTWAMDLGADVEETKEVEAKKLKFEEQNPSKLASPQSLASKIEAELFTLFGGVNKKYKEKGRSLLFNLKDRNNPELRDRVMSGAISPERLCAMSAEELASKELSEWRMAKAEELAQMVVLPESDVDIRRLVRKTHKGEFQVEVEQDDGLSVEVSVGSNAIVRPKQEDKNANISCSFTITNDVAETDFMQGLMSDEFKDAEFLTPIVSLDEFMQSLDTEPPFQNLQVDGEKTGSPLDKKSLEGEDHTTPADKASKAPTEVSGKVDTEAVDSVGTKLRHGSKKERHSLQSAVMIGEQLWEGLLQLNVSAGVNAVGYFKSGEKTSTKEWPALLEIKGRVRLDAFEKFIQGLPMSRSRAVMLAHFALKEDSSNADHATLGEAIHSYVLDERLGIAEPIPGAVEIYFCPPHPKMLEMLCKHLSRSLTENINSIEKGLIAVIVWRRVHITSNISPNSTSHHKHISKKPHQFSPTTSNISNNMTNVKSTPLAKPSPHQFDDEEDDDIPPGFGPTPTRARDEDDLPEFNFSSGPMHKQNVSNSRPVDQMRELVLKYGQIENSNNKINNNNNSMVGGKRWSVDDEDDIPEWQPGQQLMMSQQKQSWVPLRVNQLPPGMVQRPNPGANLGGQVYGVQRYPPRTSGF